MSATLAPLSGLPPALPRPVAHGSIRSHLTVALGLSVALVLGVGGWATFTEISAAVIAPGQLVVETDVKKVQHPTGGVVGQLLAREGQRVAAGDVLIRLDETQTRANLDIVLKAMDELAARRARESQSRPSFRAPVSSPRVRPVSSPVSAAVRSPGRTPHDGSSSCSVGARPNA